MDSKAARRIPSLALVVILGAAVLAGGYLIGRSLLSRESTDPISQGTLVEVQLETGAVLVGSYAGSRHGYLMLALPAALEPLGEGAGPVRVLPLSAGAIPFTGDVLVDREHVVLIGAVADGSELQRRYFEAVGATPPASEPVPSG